MQAPHVTLPSTVWVLGTGGTISGLAPDPNDTIGYTAGQVDVGALVGQAVLPTHVRVFSEQIAQVDSKDMTWAIWLELAHRVVSLLAMPETAGVVITHGTDTMEETAYFLSIALGDAVSRKPVVLTGAMLPASAPHPDGPGNIADALMVAATEGAHGVLLAMAGQVWDAMQGQKLHSGRLDAFGARDGESLAQVSQGKVTLTGAWPDAVKTGHLPPMGTPAPWVEIISSGTQANPHTVAVLVDAGVQGLVVATTGNGTVHEALQPALESAQSRGVQVVRASRTAHGHIRDGHPNAVPNVGALSPYKARAALMLQLAQA